MAEDSAAPALDDLLSRFEQASGGDAPLTSFERFQARAQALLADGQPLSAERAGDLCLACGCEDGHPAALAQFDQRLLPAARAAIARIIAPLEDLIDDAIQELRSRLFTGPAPRIAAYSGRGPLWKWLRITATRVAHDLLRARGVHATAGEDALDSLLADDPDPDVRLMRERYREVFRQALSEALTQLTPTERALVRLRYVQNQNIDALALSFRAHRATVARWLQTIRRRILDQVLARLSESEVHSLWRAVRSQVHVSFSRLFEEKPDENS
jgi:RNA polymerase sigma-70 factor (ECF subfamily)